MHQFVIEIKNHMINHEDGDEKRSLFSFREELENLPPLFSECCIYTVPHRLKKQNVEAYTPQVVSFGPIHHNKNHKYNQMEVDKKRYLKPFLDKIGMSWEEALQFITDRETGIRNCYQQVIDLTSSELVRVVLVDAVFAFTVICGGPEELRVENDRIFHGSAGSTWLEEVYLDLLLLENQLPFFIFEDLFKLVLDRDVLNEVTKDSTSIHLHCYESFKFIAMQVPDNIKESKHIIDLLRRCLYPSSGLHAAKEYDYSQILPTATELKKAGVKFKVGYNGTLLDIEFKNGVLKIPQIFVDFRTEIMFRNILAFEQCHCDDRYVTEYIFFMYGLIKTPKDVEVLVENQIMVNGLGASESASTLFNNLGKGLTSRQDNYYFGTLFEDLIAYRKSSLNNWMADFRHNYFGTPWMAMSVVAAILLLALTLMQTIYTMLAYYREKK